MPAGREQLRQWHLAGGTQMSTGCGSCAGVAERSCTRLQSGPREFNSPLQLIMALARHEPMKRPNRHNAFPRSQGQVHTQSHTQNPHGTGRRELFPGENFLRNTREKISGHTERYSEHERALREHHLAYEPPERKPNERNPFEELMEREAETEYHMKLNGKVIEGRLLSDRDLQVREKIFETLFDPRQNIATWEEFKALIQKNGLIETYNRVLSSEEKILIFEKIFGKELHGTPRLSHMTH